MPLRSKIQVWKPIVPRIGFGTSIGRMGRRRIDPQHPRLGLIAIAVTLVGGSGVVFDVLTPRTLSATLFYLARSL
jgi:hypothetical protein